MKEIDWSKAPEGYDFALSTAADWNGAPELKGTVRFASRDGLGRFKDDTGMYPQIGRSSWEVIAERPVSWAGEGLPPVGGLIEWSDDSGHHWLKVEVVGHYMGAVVAVDPDSPRDVYIGKKSCYRPIRTPEQIAAEEREKAIKEMLALDPYLPGTQLGMMSRADFCRALHDAGYRKVTP